MSGTSLATGGIISNVGTTVGADWTDAEKEQIRSALGVDGLKTLITDSELYDLISDLPTAATTADAVWDEDLSTHTTTKTSGKILQQIKSIANAIIGLIS